LSEWLYGRHAVEEALRSGRRKVFRVLLAEGDKERPQLRSPQGTSPSIEAMAKVAGAKVERVPQARLDTLLRVGRHHQGVAAEVSPFEYDTMANVVQLCRDAGSRALVLVLDSLQDPQNFGTLLRTSEAAGVTAVVMLDRRQVEVTPAVANSSAGAVEHLHICLTNNLPRAVETLQGEGLWVYALQSEPDATSYTSTDLSGPVGLVVGSEGRGVGRLVRERCDGAIAIPQMGKIESLNAAVAGSIALYEVVRQRLAKT
jgi:23S rRNA (guanosine2251-2'-O)-methyltransferase